MSREMPAPVDFYPTVRLRERVGELVGGWVDALERRGVDAGAIAAERAAWEAKLLTEMEIAAEVGRMAAREPDHRMEEFAHLLVHELKGPLANVRVGVEMVHEILGAAADEETLRYLRWIERGTTRALDLLDDIRLLALAESPHGVGRRLSIRAVVEGVFAQLRESAGRSGVLCELEEPVPDAEVDAVQPGVALMNLVGNSIKYADPAKPVRWVRVAVQRVDALGWRYTVADNGRGIPAAVQPEVFRRHFRAHPDVAEGTGLGLAIAHQVVEQRGGSIWFASEEGRGTEFHFIIPDRGTPALEVEELPLVG